MANREGDDEGNHGYKDGGKVMHSQTGAGRMNSKMSMVGGEITCSQSLLLWLGVLAGSSQTRRLCA